MQKFSLYLFSFLIFSFAIFQQSSFAADIENGERIFTANCSACHALDGDAKSASAPPLGGIVGRKIGTTAFSYSKAMKNAGFNWSKKHLYMYLKNPSKYIPGNRMAFAGLQNESDLANIIAYLESN